MARWTPLAMPELRDSFTSRRTRLQRLLRRGGRPHADRDALLGAAAEEPLVRFRRDDTRELFSRGASWNSLGDLDMFWCSRDFTLAALDLGVDIPEWTLADVPHPPAGLLAWEGGLPETTVSGAVPTPTGRAIEQYPAVIDGVVWWQSPAAGGDHTHVEFYSLDARHAAKAARWGITPANCNVSLLRSAYALALDHDVPLRGIGEYLHESDPDSPTHIGHMLDMLGATWLLSQTESMAETRRTWRDPDRAKRQPDKTERPVSNVTVIDTRRQPLRHVAADRDEKTGRTYTHRWVVRAHVRQQAYGPGRALRRAVVIEPYIKGPEGAPLVAKEKVFAWR